MSKGFAKICDMSKNMVQVTSCARNPGKGTVTDGTSRTRREQCMEVGTYERFMELTSQRQPETSSGGEAPSSATVRQEVRVFAKKEPVICNVTNCRVCVGKYWLEGEWAILAGPLLCNRSLGLNLAFAGSLWAGCDTANALPYTDFVYVCYLCSDFFFPVKWLGFMWVWGEHNSSQL